VTLTVPNVPDEHLRTTLNRMIHGLGEIARAIRRTDGLKLKALRKIITATAKRGDYHPHSHIVVAGRAQAEALVRRWLDRFPEARQVAQHITACDTRAVQELFKYLTKLITKRDGKRGTAPTAMLDVIFQVMHGRRVLQPMGFKVAPIPDEEGKLDDLTGTPAVTRLADQIDWTWLPTIHH